MIRPLRAGLDGIRYAQKQEATVNLNSILIGTEDPDRLVAYYTRLFGQPAWSEGGYTGWRIGSGSVTVAAHSEVHGRNAHPGRLIWNIESADVRGDFEHFRAAGATVIQAPYAMGEADEQGLVATFADPDDNYFQLNSPMSPEPSR
jgi:predicted enzyme related to lactoylglutathione lyase